MAILSEVWEVRDWLLSGANNPGWTTSCIHLVPAGLGCLSSGVRAKTCCHRILVCITTRAELREECKLTFGAQVFFLLLELRGL